jgi:signal transduction histidine kinase
MTLFGLRRPGITAVLAATLLGAAMLAGCGSSGTQTTPSPSAPAGAAITRQQVTDLVDLTCAAVEKDAQGTFAAIDAGAAPYVDPQNAALYVFVFDRDVTNVADPDPAFQGRCMKGVPDAAGKLFRDALVSGAFADGSGWIEYVKEEPGKEGLYRKESYYRLVTGSDGEQYVVGAGRYLGPWEGTPSPSPSAAAAPSRAAVKRFVDEAWELARTEGREKAVETFMDTGGPFYRDGLYVFAYDMDGTVLCLPAEPRKVGDDRWDAQDPAGAYFVREFVQVAEGPGQGWVKYQYINPARGDELEQKTSYVRRVDDTWLLGAGTYAPIRPTRAQVVEFVERALAYVEENGKDEALREFSDPEGEFRAGELYIFAEDFQGNELASGGQPELVGQNILDVRDANGVYLVKELIATARDKGRGWVGYIWENPETGEQQAKRAFVIRAGEDWYVGSGMYVR